MRVSVKKQANVANYEHVGQNEPENEESIGLGLLMRAVALDSTTVNLDKNYTSIDSPCGKKWRNYGHLHERNRPEAIQSLPCKIGCQAPVRLLLLSRLGSGVTRDHLPKEVHQAE